MKAIVIALAVAAASPAAAQSLPGDFVLLRDIDPTIIQDIPAQRRWRNLLVAAMAKQGFVNYSKEWWHFSLPSAGGQAYDFPISARHK